MQRQQAIDLKRFVLCLKNDVLTSISIYSREKQDLLLLCCWDGCANLFECVALKNRKLNSVSLARICPSVCCMLQHDSSKKFIRTHHTIENHAHRTVCFERPFLMSTLGNHHMRSSDGAYFTVCRSLYLQLPIFAIPKSVVP